ncbi:baseplate J/gp47 family protein [Mangrovivirga sp. M17]|uniref:Baseplate J/gp47 family protein n=1 Tax=Mangrovivirga halotolerans TaxID=2993936 RepID=A0ABT3RMX7_9BACT|nr:baseplate J/gp47 family protein [Mangrovivirga halotolerans]MCX2742693.1 baseplate J/gp47 family protein [Mangrovivirga halotolerans]
MESGKISVKGNSGTTQRSRFFKALNNQYVKIDERSFEDLLVYTKGLSKLINYFNNNNEVDGDWSYFFSDETVILAAIIDSEPAKLEDRFKKAISKARLFKKESRKIKYLLRAIKEVYSLALNFEEWYKELKNVEEFTQSQVNIRNEIFNAISSKLNKALDDLKVISSLKELKSQSFDFNDFSPVWQLNEDQQSEKISFKAAPEKLQETFQSFYETLLYLKSKTPDYLRQSLESDIHYPEIALFLSFLKIFEHAQDGLNGLTAKHLDFYFSKILQQRKDESELDKIFLQFKLNDEAEFVNIKEGTKFLAELKSGKKDKIYIADNEILVNKAEIKQLKSIFIDRDYLNIKGKERILVSNVLTNDFPEEHYTTGGYSDLKVKKPYAVFGESQQGKGLNEKTMDTANVGFAISSPVLFLSEGVREIQVVLQFSELSFELLEQYLKDLSIKYENSVEEVFVKVFADAFNIKLTSSEGWLNVNRYVITQNVKKKALRINFDIDKAAPAIIGYDKKIHEGNFKTDLPVIKLELNDHTFTYPYSLISSLVLEQVQFDVKVSEYKNLQVHNQIGRLNHNAPFIPFGPMPKAGSYLVIGSNEVFQKSIDNLEVNIDWFDLPDHKSGFSQHYKEYKSDIDNTSFEFSLSVLDNGGWKPQEKGQQQKFKLFRTKDKGAFKAPSPAAPLQSHTVISGIDVSKIKQAPNYAAINRDLALSAGTQRGFIRLELVNPRNGFGHDVYPAILSEVTIENSRTGLLKNKEKSKQDLPAKPYTPQISSLSLNYEASSAISLIDRSKRDSKKQNEAGQLFYLHPHGENLVYPDNAAQSTTLLPGFGYEGALLIGLSGIRAPQLLNLFVEMIDEYTISSEIDPPEIEWSYLANDKWYTLAPSKILRDETNRFLRTGIITLEIPADISTGNSTLDKDLFWIRAAAVKNAEAASSLLSAGTQVITASLSSESVLEDDYLENPLPAFTVKRSVNNIEGIQRITQPLPSFGGKPEEDNDSFYIGVGERLRHKQRAITIWDYERLVLDEFPQVHRATCLPNMSSEKVHAPGNILMIVTPGADNAVNKSEPMASSELLYDIKDRLNKQISPFIKLEVRNPHYERIKIICAVKFSDGYNYGYYIQKLNEQINRYLTGTLQSQNRNVELGGTIHSSDILSFLRTLPYVEFITRFSMIQVARDYQGNHQLIDTARVNSEKSSLTATKPWSVLVPAPEHQISVLINKSEEVSRQAGIDYLELGHDFIIED